jgi:hypothetical protein
MIKKKKISARFNLCRNIFSISIQMDPLLLGKFYNFLIKEKKKSLFMMGFEKGTIPEYYIKISYNKVIEKALSEVFFSMNAHEKIINKLRQNGLFINLYIKPKFIINLNEKLLEFKYEIFDRSVFKEILNKSKKFKIPIRKKYKDLDKQAETIINQELINYQNNKNNFIEFNDWVKINIKIIDVNEQIEIDEMSVEIWLNISKELIDKELRDLFCGKNKGDKFSINSRFLQEFICPDTFIPFLFSINILDIVKNSYFDFDIFSKYFKCKDQNQLIQRIIDILSFRNDISLRRETCQLVMKNLLQQYKVYIDEEAINSCYNEIEKKILFNPDYLIFQADKMFYKNIKMLACRQTQELTLIDYLSFIDETKISDEDVKLYLNILQRPRLKDFLFFDNSLFQYQSKATPFFHEIIKQMVLREKTLQNRINILIGI